MDRKRRFSRLGAKLVGASVLALALAFAIFYLVDGVAVPGVLYSEWFARFRQSRNEAALRAYQERVTERGLTTGQVLEDTEGLLDGAASGIYTVMVGYPVSVEAAAAGYGGGDVGYSFTWAGVAEKEAVPSSSVEFVMELYQIQCADGVVYVSTPPAALRYAGVGRVAGLLLALAGFCAVVVPCIVRLLGRIGALSRETGALMAGDLSHSVRVPGRDELSELGGDIERLRRSVLERVEGERAAVAANSRLIASLSHDLRTPLTRLTGYLDILLYRRYRDREERDAFLRLAAEKAAQLKDLTDQLFGRAQVDAPETALEREPEVVDGAALLGQLLSEQCGDLRREGFDVRPPAWDREFQLRLRPEDAVRVFDNLFSNLRKYADPAFPIRVQLEDGPETVTLRLENRALPAPDRADSHALGVPTMRELMARCGGTLEVSRPAGAYVSTLRFPKWRGRQGATP